MVMIGVGIFVGGFFSGLLTLVALQALGLYFLIKRFNQKTQKLQQQPHTASSSCSSHQDLDPHQSLDFAHNKKGFVWVLESDKVQKNSLGLEKAPKELKKKKELLEVTPIRKYAKIKDRSLFLTDSDGSLRIIPLKGCTIEAVSATSLTSRKWAKRYPIKVESKTLPIHNASGMVFIFLETSWEKESWCKALRLASCDDKEKLNWFTKLNEDFHHYLTSLNTGYPSFMKPSVGFNAEPIDREVNRLDCSESKVRQFLKKLARKASKTGVENKVNSLLGREERKVDPALAGSLAKYAPTAKASIISEEENVALHSSSAFSRASSQSQIVISEADSDEKFNIDEGTLCWNLLISRLFFDAKSNANIKSLAQARIKRTLSNMRTPSYIGEVICTDLNLGNLPPYIHGIRVLPTDMNEAWAWEVEIEYCGGLVLDIETRLEVRDLDLHQGVMDTNSGSSSAEHVSPDLLEGFEYFGEQLNLSEGTVDAQERKDAGNPKHDGVKDSTSGISTSTNASRWKSILKSVAKQVSQVPLSLSIRAASLRGTVRFHIKPPPSDQLWYGFTSMPDVEFELESSVGECKIPNGHIALFLISKFKAAIRETMVLPNCENVCIPWMLAEKNDWVPRNVAPFIWIHQEATSDSTTVRELFSSQPDEAKTKTDSGGTLCDHLESKDQKTWNAEYAQQPISDTSDALTSSVSSAKPSMKDSHSLEEPRTPLLASSEAQETGQQSRVYIPESQSPSRSLIPLEKQNHAVAEDDSKPKKMGRRAKMLDLGKKMGEKLEEKRRHIEEKGRNIVEKMRGP